ncbi:succinyl-diaminopimelate desuccinylase [Paracoccaceae bacterium GXU_MW_L88]
MVTDPVALTQDLIRCASVTPEEGGALILLEEKLTAAGFVCSRVDRGGVANLFARWGESGPVFGFNGHTDVVPAGDEAAWTHPPFSGDIENGVLWGRGATDMKSGVAAFVAAAIDFVEKTPPSGSISLAITGDEEGQAQDGTRALLDWMATQGERMDVCLVGEPTCPETLGEMMKIGRRGSITCEIIARGQQGHVAYPHRALNPLPALVAYLDRLANHTLDEGTAHFDPSTLAITTIDVGNPASNVIPAEAFARMNIRFNDLHSETSLTDWFYEMIPNSDVAFDLKISCSGEAFITPPGTLSDLIANAVKAETGIYPILSTSGGTSDARFMRKHCPVVEFGLVGKTMHQVDERIEISQIETLKAIYTRILSDYFAS